MREKEIRAERKFRKKRPLLMILIGFLLLGGLLTGAAFLPFTVESVTGLGTVSEEELTEKLFPGGKLRGMDIAVSFFRKKSVPGILTWELKPVSFGSVRIDAGEEETVAAARAEGEFLILSENGNVLAVTSKEPEGLLLITGFGISPSGALSVPEVQDREAFEALLLYAGMLGDMDIPVTSLRYSGGGCRMFTGDVEIDLGTTEYAAEKLSVVQEQLPLYESLKGTLHLENYVPGGQKERFIFEVRTE